MQRPKTLQWWSKCTTHLWQMLQWCVFVCSPNLDRRGLKKPPVAFSGRQTRQRTQKLRGPSVTFSTACSPRNNSSLTCAVEINSTWENPQTHVWLRIGFPIYQGGHAGYKAVKTPKINNQQGIMSHPPVLEWVNTSLACAGWRQGLQASDPPSSTMPAVLLCRCNPGRSKWR